MIDLNITNISQELSKLHQAQKGKNVMRANLFTLIIYAHDDLRSRYLYSIIQSIIDKYPCRIIFVHVDRTQNKNLLRVSVSSAQNNSGGISIVCDQIVIEAGLHYLNRVPFILLPHLLPDLPVYLLWGQDPTNDCEILGPLEKFANRLLIDAECTQNLQRFSQTIIEKKKTLSIDLMDINWALCSGWRDVIALAFSLPEHLKQLQMTKKMTIAYNGLPGDWIHQPEVQSIYLQAWLSCRLGWTFQSMSLCEKERTLTYTSPRGQAEVTLIPKESPRTYSGGILSVEAFTYDSYHFVLSRDKEQPKVMVDCSSPLMCELPFSLALPDTKRGVTFMSELFYSIPSTHYEEVLNLIKQIDWQ